MEIPMSITPETFKYILKIIRNDMEYHNDYQDSFYKIIIFIEFLIENKLYDNEMKSDIWSIIYCKISNLRQEYNEYWDCRINNCDHDTHDTIQDALEIKNIIRIFNKDEILFLTELAISVKKNNIKNILKDQ